MYVYNMPRKINTNLVDINKFISMCNRIKIIEDKDICFDFKDTSWFSGEMVALFGAICHMLVRSGYKPVLRCPNNIIGILKGNDFLNSIADLGYNAVKSTAIPFRNFESELIDGNLNCFDEYIKKELEDKVKLRVTEVNYIVYYLSELFINARTHGGTNSIFCCGQQYPNMKKIKVMLVDLGVGIPFNVTKKIGTEKKDCECIRWSLEKGNSTKLDAGGLGLYDIFEFVKSHDGNISIISLNGQYSYRDNVEIDSINRFDGTIIYIEFDYTKVNAENLFGRIRKKNSSIEF